MTIENALSSNWKLLELEISKFGTWTKEEFKQISEFIQYNSLYLFITLQLEHINKTINYNNIYSGILNLLKGESVFKSTTNLKSTNAMRFLNDGIIIYSFLISNITLKICEYNMHCKNQLQHLRITTLIQHNDNFRL